MRNRRLVVIDDSIVRGNTSKQLVQMLRDAGAKEVHMRIVSPPVSWPCFYGIDTDNQDQLISANMDVESIREYIGADSLSYLTEEGLRSCIYAAHPGYCTACFSGMYPVSVPDYMTKNSFLEGNKPVWWPQERDGMSEIWQLENEK